MTSLRDLARWPTSSDDTTAAALIRHAWVMTTWHATRAIELAHRPAGDPLFMAACAAQVDAFAVATTLEALTDADPGRADETARRIWEGADDGGHPGELAWDRAQVLDIDHAAVVSLAKRSVAAIENTAVSHSITGSSADVPRPVLLEMWLAVFPSNRSAAFDAFYAEHGHKRTWGHVMSGIQSAATKSRNDDAMLQRFVTKSNRLAEDVAQLRVALDFLYARQVADGLGGIKFTDDRVRGASADALAWYGAGVRDEPGRDEYPHDAGDLGACERTYAMAVGRCAERMLPVLEKFRAHAARGYRHPEPTPPTAPVATQAATSIPHRSTP